MPQNNGIPTIEEVRQKYPEYDHLSDTEVAQGLYLKQQPDQDFETFAQDIGFDPSLDRAKFSPQELKQRQENLEEMGSFERGLRGGIEKTKGLLAGGLGAVGHAAEETIGVGESLADWGISEYQENMREARLKYPQETSFQELVKDPSLSGAAEWGLYTLGDLAPTIATTMGTGLAGGVASGAVRAAGQAGLRQMAKRVGGQTIKQGIEEAGQKLVNRKMAKGLAEQQARKMVEKGIGMQAGVVAGGGALESGEMYGSSVQELGKEEVNPFKALTLGAAAGAVELAGGNIRILKRLFGTQAEDGVKAAIELAKRSSKARPQALQFLSRMAGEAARQAPAEMGQESAQEAMQIANMQWQDPEARKVLTEENAWQLIEAGAAGGLAGGVMGGAGATAAQGTQRAFEGTRTAEDQAQQIENKIERIRENKKVLPENMQQEADQEMQRLQGELENISTQVLKEQKGKVPYDEAARQLEQEAPQPSGKKTTTKAVRKLAKKGKIQADRFGVNKESLRSHIQERQRQQINFDTGPEKIADQMSDVLERQGEQKDQELIRRGQQDILPRLMNEWRRAREENETELADDIAQQMIDLKRSMGEETGDQKLEAPPPKIEAAKPQEEQTQQLREEAEDALERARTARREPNITRDELNNRMRELDTFLASGMLESELDQTVREERQAVADRMQQVPEGREQQVEQPTAEQPAAEQPAAMQEMDQLGAEQPTGQDLVGRYVRSGSKVGRVASVDEETNQATLEDGSIVPVGEAPNWEVSDQPFVTAEASEAEIVPPEGAVEGELPGVGPTYEPQEQIFTDQEQARQEAERLTTEGRPHQVQPVEEGYIVQPTGREVTGGEAATEEGAAGLQERATQAVGEARERKKSELRNELNRNRRLTYQADNGNTHVLTKSAKGQGFQLTTLDENMEPISDEQYSNVDQALESYVDVLPQEEVRPDLPDDVQLAPDRYQYVYEGTRRPVGPGAVPRDGLAETREGGVYGRAVYDRPLNQREIEQFDLEPVQFETRTGAVPEADPAPTAEPGAAPAEEAAPAAATQVSEAAYRAELPPIADRQISGIQDIGELTGVSERPPNAPFEFFTTDPADAEHYAAGDERTLERYEQQRPGEGEQIFRTLHGHAPRTAEEATTRTEQIQSDRVLDLTGFGTTADPFKLTEMVNRVLGYPELPSDWRWPDVPSEVQDTMDKYGLDSIGGIPVEAEEFPTWKVMRNSQDMTQAALTQRGLQNLPASQINGTLFSQFLIDHGFDTVQYLHDTSEGPVKHIVKVRPDWMQQQYDIVPTTEELPSGRVERSYKYVPRSTTPTTETETIQDDLSGTEAFTQKAAEEDTNFLDRFFAQDDISSQVDSLADNLQSTTDKNDWKGLAQEVREQVEQSREQGSEQPLRDAALQSNRIPEQEKGKLRETYNTEGAEQGNKLTNQLLIESGIENDQAKQKLAQLRQQNRMRDYYHEVNRNIGQRLVLAPANPAYQSTRPQELEQALVGAMSDTPLTQEDQALLTSHIDENVESEAEASRLKDQVTQAETVGDLLTDQGGLLDEQAAPDSEGDIQAANAPGSLQRFLFEARDENGQTVLDRKGFKYRLELPQGMRTEDQSRYVYAAPGELDNYVTTDDQGNLILPRIAGFKLRQTITDPASETGTSEKTYVFQTRDKAALSKREQQEFDQGYQTHIPRSALEQTEEGFSLRIDGRSFNVATDETLSPEAREQQQWPPQSKDVYFTTVDDKVKRKDLTQKVSRRRVSKQLNDIAEGFTQGSRNINVHDSPRSSTVPRDILAEIEKEGIVDTVAGTYDYNNDQVHIFLNRHGDSKGQLDKRKLTQTMLHEAVLHGGLTKMFGRDQKYREFIRQVQKAYKNELPDPREFQYAPDKFRRTVEEFIAKKIERTEITEKGDGAFEFVNPEIKTWFDRIASFITKAGRKIANALGTSIDMTKPEIRQTLAKLYKGQDLKTSHGLGHLIPGDLKPAKDVPPYSEFATYEENRGDALLRKLEDQFRPFVTLTKSLEKEGIELGDYENPEQALRIYPGKVEPQMRRIEQRQTEVSKILSKNNLTLEDLRKYLWAMHAPERNQRIRNNPEMQKNVPQEEVKKGASGIYDETANQWMQELRSENKLSGAQEAAQLVWRTNEEFLDKQIFYGLKSPREIQNMRDTFDYFVPMGPEEEFEKVVRSPGMAGATDLVKGLAPAEEAGQDPMMLSFKRAQMGVVNGEKNHVRQTIYRLALNHPNNDIFELYLSDEDFERLRQEMGLSAEAMNKFIRERGLKRTKTLGADINNLVKENQLVPVVNDGQKSYVRINHEGLRRSLLQEGVVRGGKIMRAHGSLSRWLVVANTMLNPEFIYTNLFRDVGTAVGNTISMQRLGRQTDTNRAAKDVGTTVPRAIKGIGNYHFGDGQHEFAGWYEDYMNNGGKIGTVFMGLQDPAEMVENMEKDIKRRSEGGLLSALKKNKDAFWDKIERVNEMFENASRLSAYKVAVDNGVSKPAAARMARELTVDFNRKGELGQMMNTLYLFSNAGVGGSARLLRGLKNSPKAQKIIGSIALAGFSMGILNRFMGGQDDDGRWNYEKISDDTRARHIIMAIPGADGAHVKVPLPYGFGAFYKLGEEASNFAMGERGHDAFSSAGRIMGAFTHNFNPFGGAGNLNTAHGWLQLVSPTLGDPIVDIGLNKSPFGSPLSPRPEYKGQPDSQRHWDSVGTVSKEVTQWLNEITGGAPETPGLVDMSPETMDYMLNTFSGAAGKFWLSRLPGFISGRLRGKELENINDAPGLRRVMGEPFDWQNRQLFNEASNEVQGAAERLSNMQKRMQYARTKSARNDAMETIRNFQRENRDLLALNEQRKNAFAQIKDLDTRKEQIRKSGYSQARKDELLNQLDDRQYKIMKQFNSRFLDTVK